GLTTAILVDQERMGSDPRSTVGTATDANAMLRILFSRLAQPQIGSPQAYSFNVASISGAGAVTVEKSGRKTKERRSFSVTGGINLTYLGLVPQIKKSFLAKDVESMQSHIRAFVERAVTFTTCPDCDGTRLSELARSSRIEGKNIADVCAMQISDLAVWVRGL